MDRGGGDGAAKVILAGTRVLWLGHDHAAVMPDQAGVLVLGVPGVELVVDGRKVLVSVFGLLGQINTPEMADARRAARFGILADADVDLVVVNDRAGDEIALGAA